MALKKYYLNTGDGENTKVVKSDAEGLLFNTLLYNLGSININIKFYLENDNGDIVLYQDTLSAGERVFLEEKFSLEGEDIKIYSSDDIQIIVQILDN